MGARVQRLVHGVAHIDQQGLQLVGGLVVLATERRRVGVVVGRLVENGFYCSELVFQFHCYRGYLALHIGRAVRVLQIAHEFLASGDQLLGSVGHGAPERGDQRERLAAPNVGVEPQLHVVVLLTAFVPVEEQQVLEMRGELARGVGVSLAGSARLGGERVEQHRTFTFFRRDHPAFRAHEHVARRLFGRHLCDQAQDILRGERERKGATRFGFGSMGLVDHPIADGRQQAPVGG